MEVTLITLSPLKRRIVYVSLFELFAILLSTLILMALSDGSAQNSLPVAVIVSATAVLWNYLYNLGFEAWERRNHVMQRTLRVRCIHAVGFEGGLLLFCLPVYMLWYGVGPLVALGMELTLMVFFLFYTFVFTLVFDKIFTLPQHYAELTPAEQG
ncbi:PACE efflux transporter [Bordetella trematum]|uniref:PACE efflux transporter n=1 Tax=Bordetella trematum TaxID=123899 RepID=UPI000C77B321|nr:PACE efflux transporter [Bordetella trematum]